MPYEQVNEALLREQEKRRMLQKDMMKSSAYNPYQQVSGRSVPYSPIQGLSSIAKAMIQRSALDKSDERTEALTKQYGEERGRAFSEMMDTYQGREEAFDVADMTTPEREDAIEADPLRATMMAATDPYLEGAGSVLSEMRGGRGGSRSRPIATSEGYYEPTAQGWQPMQGAKGPLMSPYADPTTQGDVAAQRERNKLEQQLRLKGDVAADVESKKIIGAAGGQAIVDLPAAEFKAAETLTLVDELLDHPGFEDAVGFWDNPLALGGLMPATEAAGFKKRLKQLEGRTFMEIFPTLKGGGQITEIEGTKGQGSINRMSQATNEKEFIEAANAFKTEVERLRGIVRARAGVQATEVTKPDDIDPALWDALSEEDKALWTN